MIPKLKLQLVGDFDPATAPQVKSVLEVLPMLRADWQDMNRIETFKVVLLNSVLKVIGIVDVSVGAIDHCTCDIRVIIQAALLSNATQIIVAHNHPSGSVKPSEADRVMTKKIRKACDTMRIHLIDSLILSPYNNDFFSILND